MKYVYAIQHNQTKKIYVGCSKNITNRYLGHLSALRSGRHASKEMQDDFDKYGDDFSIFVLEEIANPSEILKTDKGRTIRRDHKSEYEWMRKYKTIYEGYNQQDGKARKYIENDYKIPVKITIKQGLPEI